MRSVLAFIAAVLVCLVVAENSDAPEGFVTRTLFKPRTCRRAAELGDIISFMYTGAIAPNSPTGTPGEVFDKSEDNNPVATLLSPTKLLTGLQRGLMGVCEGERRVITIPPQWGFGTDGHLDVPGNAIVQFTVHVVGVDPHVDTFHEIDTDGNNCLSITEIMRFLEKQRVRPDQLETVARRMMEHDDDNGDGFISCKEFSGPTICDFHEPAWCEQTWAALDDVSENLEFVEDAETAPATSG